MKPGSWRTIAKLLTAIGVGAALYQFAPKVAYGVLAVGLGIGLSIESAMADRKQPRSQIRCLIQACACCVVAVAPAPWALAGAGVCLIAFVTAGVVARAFSYEIPRILLWLSPLAAGVAVWLT